MSYWSFCSRRYYEIGEDEWCAEFQLLSASETLLLTYLRIVWVFCSFACLSGLWFVDLVLQYYEIFICFPTVLSLRLGLFYWTCIQISDYYLARVLVFISGMPVYVPVSDSVLATWHILAVMFLICSLAAVAEWVSQLVFNCSFFASHYCRHVFSLHCLKFSMGEWMLEQLSECYHWIS